MKNLKDISTWKEDLGLLPIRLKPTVDNLDFLLLNGGYGDFCIRTGNGDDNRDEYYSKSWSSNTKNFIVLKGNKLKVYNWLKKEPEVIPQKLVNQNIDKFYKYLLSKTYKSTQDIVPHIINVFRQFRNLTFEKTNPIEALNLLFILLAGIEDDVTSIDAVKWNLIHSNIPKGFEVYLDKIQNIESNIKPQLDLIIRHSAGVLFQEAQKEVLFFNPQEDLFGIISNKLKTNHNLYSSIHYTPPYVSRTVVENSLQHIDLKVEKLKIFDPACGSAEFLIEVLIQLKELNFKGEIQVIGWDTSETAVNTSNFLLKYEKRTIWNDKLSFKIVLVEDSLTETWEKEYDLILMNPPFISWELLNKKKSRDAVRETLGNTFANKPNQASAFFYKSINHLSKNGVIGCIIPSSLLTLDSYKKLRNEANETISIKLLGKLGNFVFEDAFTDVSIIIGKKPITDIAPKIIWTKNEKGIVQEALRDLRKDLYTNDGNGIVDEANYSIFTPINFPVIPETWKSVSYKENEFLKALTRDLMEKKLVPLLDVFSVKQGINSGNNKLFKINKNEYLNLSELDRLNFRPVVDNNSINNGELSPKTYVWYPYNAEGIKIKTEEDLKKQSPDFYNKIYPFKTELSTRARKNDTNWWFLSEHRSWLLKKEPRLVSARFGNAKSFAFDKTGDYIVENGNAWIPKKDFIDSDYYFYLALFSSDIFNQLLSIYSKQLSGGNWFDLGRKYSQNIPIPNVHYNDLRNSTPYIKLTDIGREIASGNIYAMSISEEILVKYFYPHY